MKKKFLKLTAMLLAALMIASCTAAAAQCVPLEKMLGFDRAEDRYTSELNSESQLSYSACMDDGDETVMAVPVAVNFRMPDDWLDLGSNIYQTYRGDNNCAVLCMKAPYIYKKPDGFVLDGTVHDVLSKGSVRVDISAWNYCTYRTAGGYDSIIYYNYDSKADSFSLYAYIDLDESYVLEIDLYDRTEMRGQMMDILDSITLAQYDAEADYSTTELAGYMNYLVNYFHEPYKAGDDISEINVLYLCLQYAYANRVCYYDIGYDLERQVITVPLERAEEICTGLLGDDVNISSFDTYLYGSDRGDDGTYGGVDGVGYVVSYATDYWNGDLWHIDHEKYSEPLEITENGDSVTVKAHIYYGMIGDYEDPRILEYTFEKVSKTDAMNNGHIYYRLTEIAELTAE